MRYPIRLDPIWRPLLLIAAVTPGGAYAELDVETLRLHYGPLSDESIPRDLILSAAKIEWPWWAGVGWRASFRRVGLIGSRQGVVELQLAESRRMRFAFAPWLFAVRKIAFSLEDPDAFLADLGKPTS
jgi:hypothetical protein